MYRFEPNLRIPGPTHLPPQVREAGGRQMINHRGPEFAALMDRIDKGMRVFFGTGQQVMLLTAAGTGGLEAAIVNALSPADRVIAVPVGAFGDRFAKIATVYGADVTRIDTEWGKAADPAKLRAKLEEDANFKAVLLTHNETSTGITNPIAELAAVVHELAPDALILVDAISGLGAVPFEMDAWGLDVVITGSQKAWMAAPGMTFLALSERAWAAAEVAKMPRFYFNLLDARRTAATGETPWTPAVAVMYQVDAGLALMLAETPAKVFERHAACAAATRAGLRALGFEPLADPAFASSTVTSYFIPEDLDWKSFNGEVKKRYVVLAGGQGKFKGKIFRVGHLGAVSLDDILGAISVMEDVSIEMGRPVTAGAAVAAAKAAAHAVTHPAPAVKEAVPA